MKGIDCSTRISATVAKQLKETGYGFIARYLVPDKYSKHLTAEEAKIISDSGMDILSVWETTARRASGGGSTGQPDGATAFQLAREIGQPEGSAVYFAVDYDAHPADYDAIERYLRAVGAQLKGKYIVGVYGSHDMVEEMLRRGAAKTAWQTYAWSGGMKSAKANVYQYKNGVTVAGIEVDLNESYGGEGFWNMAGRSKMIDNITS
ncbi:DUF1906 domain-containing protein [Paenibacillus tarimensis]